MTIADLVAIAVVAACAAWALRGAWRWWRGRGACGCGTCPLTRGRDRG